MGKPYSERAIKGARALTDGLGNDIAYLVNLCIGELASAHVNVDLGDLEGEVREASAETLDDSQGEGDLLLSLDVGVLHTNDVSKFVGVFNHEARLHTCC